MKYRVVLHRSEEGIAASVRGMPGGWSQGDTDEEALANVKHAIEDDLAVVEALSASLARP